MRMLGSDAILRSLEAEGVEVAFGIPGGAILPLYDAFARGTTVRHVLARHEQGAGHMAEGYARASGRVGVAIATSGPGVTNLVTPIADAWMDSTPLVCITGQVRSSLIGTDAVQETDATGITLPIVKHSWLVQDPSHLDVIASEQPFAEALASTAAYAPEGTRMVASGRVGPDGKGVFGPTHGSAPQLAGQGVANPSAMLLAAALMLGEGLGERSAARTLERAVVETLGNGVRTPDMLTSGAGATTREFMDTLLATLPTARRDTEFAGVSG